MNVCIECGKPLTRKQKKFCCVDCMWRHHNRAHKDIRYCLVCGVELSPWHKQFCSEECREEHRLNTIIKNGKPEQNAVPCKCPACHIIHYRNLGYKPKMMPRIYCPAHENRRNYSEEF